MKKIICLFASIIFLDVGYVSAAQTPIEGKMDKRITTINYQANDVIIIKATFGISTMIVFDEDEKFVTVSLGDTESWQVAPSENGNILFVKPVAKNIATNMNIVTNKRVYFLELQDVDKSTQKAYYGVRFRYPEKEINSTIKNEAEFRASFPNISTINKDNINIDYSFSGSAQLKPVRIFDDGKKTFLKFSSKTPAIFSVNTDFTETLVNFHKEGEYIVIDQTSTQFTLRDGNLWTCIFNLKKPDFGQKPNDTDSPKIDLLAKKRTGSGNK